MRRPSSFTRALVPIVVLVLTAARATDGAKRIAHPDCLVALQTWLDAARPTVDEKTAVMKVPLENLKEHLEAAKCEFGNGLGAELWRVVGEDKSGDNFGTAKYFATYRRCQDLSPDHFAHHQTLPRVEEKDMVDYLEFHHVVEVNYILRLCPCGIFDTRCNCDDAAICSKIITVPRTSGKDKVFPWCREPSPEDGNMSDILSPMADCNSANLVGTLASCTPIQPSYDRIKVIMHLVENGTADTECSQYKHHREDTAKVFSTSLTARNKTHGDFDLSAGDLLPDSVYCVTVELVDHPYCLRRIILGHGNQVTPAVCVKHIVSQPVKTTMTCDDSVNSLNLTMRTADSITTIVLVVSSSAVLLVLVLAMAMYCAHERRKQQSTSSISSSKPMVARASPQSNLKDVDAGSSDVFLLHLPDPAREHLSGRIRDWIGSMEGVAEIFDLADEARQEDILSRQEEWVTDVLDRPDVRVVAVTSNEAARSLHQQLQRRRRGEEVDNSEDEERSLLAEDAMAELRLFATRRIISQFSGQYGRFMLVAYSATADNAVSAEPDQCCADLENLTPHRRRLVLPTQAADLARWLRTTPPTQNHYVDAEAHDDKDFDHRLKMDFEKAVVMEGEEPC
jgi:hypothetical protein